MSSTQEQNIEKCQQAIASVCKKAVPSIKECIRAWQQRQRQTIGSCTGTGTCLATAGKPKSGKGSCASCVRWGQTVEAEIYPPGGPIQWSNVNPTLFSTDPFEVAKAFVLRLKTGKNYCTFGDFDSASLLMIMMGFKEFHQSDQASYNVIKKVGSLCRRTLKCTNLSLLLGYVTTWKENNGKIETSPDTAFLAFSTNTALSRNFGLPHINCFCPCCPHLLLLDRHHTNLTWDFTLSRK